MIKTVVVELSDILAIIVMIFTGYCIYKLEQIRREEDDKEDD